MQLRLHLKMVILGFVLCLGLFQGTARAAGTATISVEASPASVSPGGTVELSFYVTPNGGIVNSVEAHVTFSNLSYVSYNSTGSPFTVATVPGATTATSFDIVGAFMGYGVGVSTKSLIVRVTATASSTAGAGNVTISNTIAFDDTANGSVSDQPIPSSSQNGSVTITSPSTGGGSGGNTSNNTSNNTSSGSTTQTTQPKQSTAVVPTDSTKPGEAGEPIPAETLAAAENIETIVDTTASTTDKEPLLSQTAMIGIAAAVLTLAIGWVLIRKFQATRVRGVIGGDLNTTTTPPVNETKPTVIELPKDNDGPTIIHPQK